MNIAIQVIRIFLEVLSFAIFVRVIMSWFMMGTRNKYVLGLYQALHVVTEPILGPLRRIIPTIGMVDISPMIAIILLYIIDMLLLYAKH
jgi:YggT family protein